VSRQQTAGGGPKVTAGWERFAGIKKAWGT
jgi:hypothetical protein